MEGQERVAILPPGRGSCPVCAGSHDRKMPHDKNSLYYQMRFYQQHGRFPTWEDAMEHCSAMVKAYWRGEMAKQGIGTDETPDGR